ncbi:hypothetical protein [Elizabethkingia miricola]|uniref:Type II CBASS E2 protein domain-containing protein n=1 Tax=Elizabethkingia miricola TaxID=172045 RepID=A0ABD5B350_ELIMR|nr:hypothetical protein [Elizabethkingia miricola]MDQ8747862.1 hypothetical protein [Elizabethkingia miricola]
MDFMLSTKECAQKYWLGFLYKTMIECEKEFKWLSFEVKGKLLEGKGTLEFNNRKYHFKLLCSPFFPNRFERVIVDTKNLIKCADTHFNGDGSLCLYHPVFDVKGKTYLDLVDVIPWISEWVYYYDKYLEYKVWLGPEYPHN